MYKKNLKIKLRVDKIFKYWTCLCVLRMQGVLIFCQNLSLDASKDVILSTSFVDQGYGWKLINKKILFKLLDRKLFLKVKNFNNVLVVNNMNNVLTCEKQLISNNLLILGYYMQGFFFYKKDFNIHKIDKKCIFSNLKSRIATFYMLKKKVIMNIKSPIIKIILLLKYKN